MNVKDAVALMARNPAVDFPWQGTLITLINGFLPAAGQLDPHTAEAKEVQGAIDSMEASLQDMVYNSNIGLANVVNPLPSPVDNAKTTRAYFLGGFGLIVCVVALMLTAKVGNGATGTDVVEVLKLLLSLLPSAPAS